MNNINPTNEVNNVETAEKRLGKLPAKSSPKALMLTDFIKKKANIAEVAPEVYNFWGKRKPFPIRSFGNTQHGNCTIASQAILAMRMERLEQRRTVEFDTERMIANYYKMTGELYGGGDTGAYETDALSRWRKGLTVVDTKDRPYTIDAFVRVNAADHNAIRQALYVTGGKGIKVCFNLPWAWSRTTSDRGGVWDFPEGQPAIGDWMPGSWGGHSMTAVSDYNRDGMKVPHQWEIPDQWVTWRGAAFCMDEVHVVFDSLNWWKKSPSAKLIDFGALKEAVNGVSSQKIK